MIVSVDKRISSKEIMHHPWLANHSLTSNFKFNSNTIKTFYKGQKFKRIVLTAMVFQSDANVDELGKLFLQLDKDGDGHLSYEELFEGLQQHLGDDAKDVVEIYKQELPEGTKINYNGSNFFLKSRIHHFDEPSPG